VIFGRRILIAASVVVVAGTTMALRLTTSSSDAQSSTAQTRSTSSSPPAVAEAPGTADRPTASPATSSAAAESEGALSAAAASTALTTSLRNLFGTGDSFSVAALDLSTGRMITAGAASGMSEASLVKLDILQTALYQQQQGETTLDEADAVEMMDNSDNEAADQIFGAVGGNDALRAYNLRLGLTNTELDTDGIWGLSTTSASDQLRLLKALVSASSPLTASSRSYALDLMAQVEADQTWGVSAAADPGAATELKNGWLDIDSDDGLWAVNSAGTTILDGHRALLVVLSQHQPDYQSGVDRVQAAAKALAAALR
jgi:beta-lactamase class A